MEVVEYDRAFLDKSWEWLQDEELRRLALVPDFTREEQLRWFDDLKNRTDYVIWGFTVDSVPAGVIGLKNIDSDSAEYFAYIGESRLRGMGVGRWMHDSIVRLAREKGLHRLWGTIGNEISLRAHLKYGWRVFGVNEQGHQQIEFEL